jgi:hypothetical protein
MATPKPLRLAAVFQKVLKSPPGTMLPSDNDITTTCHQCSRKQSLFRASISEEQGDTLYQCHECDYLLTVVFPVTSQSKGWQGNGYMLNEYVIYSSSDLFIQLKSRVKKSIPPVMIPASGTPLERKPS